MDSRGDGPPTRAALARLLRREIELIRSFGWTPPLVAARRPSRANRPGGSVPPVAPGADERPAASGVEAGPHEAPPREAGPHETPPGVVPRGPEERARRETVLGPLREEVAGCTRCPLCRSRTQTVFGVGDPCARLVFIGEGPGFEEDRRGEPFVGPAGQLLDRIIGAMRLRREDVYIANIVKCRPPGNRNPAPDEMGRCFPFLERQVDVIRPDVICALGSVAARALLQTRSGVGALRGRFHEYRGVPVRVTYHPAYLLRSPHDKRKTWEDVQEVMRYLGIEPRRRPGASGAS